MRGKANEGKKQGKEEKASLFFSAQKSKQKRTWGMQDRERRGPSLTQNTISFLLLFLSFRFAGPRDDVDEMTKREAHTCPVEFSELSLKLQSQIFLLVNLVQKFLVLIANSLNSLSYFSPFFRFKKINEMIFVFPFLIAHLRRSKHKRTPLECNEAKELFLENLPN